MTTAAATGEALDLLSTSQKMREIFEKPDGVSDENFREIKNQIAEEKNYAELVCNNGAPFIFFVDHAGIARLAQGCCNSWTCERCGHLRALEEYGRMVNGAKEMGSAGFTLYFMTLTCRGRDMSLREAEETYLPATNRVLSAARAKCTAAGRLWAYASVTERQKRGHPHSHYITTFCSSDAIPYPTGARLPNGAEARHDTLYSAWLQETCVAAGLGKMADVSITRSPVAVAVYAAKYMFKDAMMTEWPPRWKRVRYSNSWPKLPRQTAEIAFPLIRFSDWLRMEALGYRVHADGDRTREAARNRSINCVE